MGKVKFQVRHDLFCGVRVRYASTFFSEKYLPVNEGSKSEMTVCISDTRSEVEVRESENFVTPQTMQSAFQYWMIERQVMQCVVGKNNPLIT